MSDVVLIRDERDPADQVKSVGLQTAPSPTSEWPTATDEEDDGGAALAEFLGDRDAAPGVLLSERDAARLLAENLAVAVLNRAVRDLRGSIAQHRQSARVFFESTWLEYWCGVVGLDPAAVRDRVGRATPARQRTA